MTVAELPRLVRQLHFGHDCVNSHALARLNRELLKKAANDITASNHEGATIAAPGHTTTESP